MSVVRIPRPEEDAFPWARVVMVAATGGALGLGIAFWGMERDRSAEAETPTSDSTNEPTPVPVPAPVPVPVPAPAPDTVPVPDSSPAPDSVPVPLPDTAPDTAPDAVPDSAPDAVPDSAPVPVPVPVPDTAPAPASGPVTLRTGRIAYLRCDGVPQRPGPFPCPRDEPLETAVWSALRAVEHCDHAPTAGAADIVVDFAGEQLTIRARDTFPSDTVRTDAEALLTCAGDSLTNVRSSLAPRRLVVSFRLTLEDRAR